jgi:hypothetical protein
VEGHCLREASAGRCTGSSSLEHVSAVVQQQKHMKTLFDRIVCILFRNLFVCTSGNTVQPEQYLLQSVLQEFLRTSMPFLSSAGETMGTAWRNIGGQ